MSIKSTVRHSGDVAIVDLAGRITLGEGSGLVRNTIKELVSSGHKRILLNLKDVTYIDSAGLGELVNAFNTVKKEGGALKLVGVTKKLKDLLVITKLSTVFDAYDTEVAALQSYGS